jgi:Flp pilus assembly protein TadG
MKSTYANNRKHLPKRRGVTFVLVVAMIVVIIGMVAFATEVGRMFLLRGEVQNAVDSGAIAAALQLRQGAAAADQAAKVARDFVQMNRAGSSVTIPADMIGVEVGIWDPDTEKFTVASDSPNAVWVFARQQEPFFFAKIFGFTAFAAPASAVAAGGGGTLDIMLVLDLSGSMGQMGRIEALRNASPYFVTTLEELGGDDQLGVMMFGAKIGGKNNKKYPWAVPYTALVSKSGEYVGMLEAALGTDLAVIKSSILTKTNLIPAKYDSYTPTGSAIRDGSHYMVNAPEARDEAKKVMVLMSDGYANRPSGNGPGYALEQAAYAASLDIKIYTISLGDEADVAFMQEIADITGGQHFDATGSGEAVLTEKLTAAFVQIAVAIKQAQLVK